MENENQSKSYFSVQFNLVMLDTPLPYDLFVNSSIIADHMHFVRIVSYAHVLTASELEDLKNRYRQLYVPEDQRTEYMFSICGSSFTSKVEKIAVLKDSAIHYLVKLFDKNKEFSTEVLAETINGSRDVVANMVDVIQNYNIDSLQDLIANLSFHDFYTYDHSINVSMYCILIYRFIRPEATRDQIIQAGLGGLFHDLGKIKISTKILNKPDKLTPQEFEEIKKHPKFGFDFLHQSDLHLAKEIDIDLISRVVYEHHENVDGTGYPNRLKKEDIHLLARITAIADFFDALTTKRAYDEPHTTGDALAIMRRSVNKKIDEEIFEAFAKQTEKYVANLVTKAEIPSDFDPCQPHRHLPLKMISALSPEEKFQDFSKEFGNIRVIKGDDESKTWWNVKSKNKSKKYKTK